MVAIYPHKGRTKGVKWNFKKNQPPLMFVFLCLPITAVCSLDCGPNGVCENGKCRCNSGWTGSLCDQLPCDKRCAEHGQCKNGTCVCSQGWNGRHCTLRKSRKHPYFSLSNRSLNFTTHPHTHTKGHCSREGGEGVVKHFGAFSPHVWRRMNTRLGPLLQIAEFKGGVWVGGGVL